MNLAEYLDAVDRCSAKAQDNGQTATDFLRMGDGILSCASIDPDLTISDFLDIRRKINDLYDILGRWGK